MDEHKTNDENLLFQINQLVKCQQFLLSNIGRGLLSEGGNFHDQLANALSSFTSIFILHNIRRRHLRPIEPSLLFSGFLSRHIISMDWSVVLIGMSFNLCTQSRQMWARCELFNIHTNIRWTPSDTQFKSYIL